MSDTDSVAHLRDIIAQRFFGKANYLALNGDIYDATNAGRIKDSDLRDQFGNIYKDFINLLQDPRKVLANLKQGIVDPDDAYILKTLSESETVPAISILDDLSSIYLDIDDSGDSRLTETQKLNANYYLFQDLITEFQKYQNAIVTQKATVDKDDYIRSQLHQIGADFEPNIDFIDYGDKLKSVLVRNNGKFRDNVVPDSVLPWQCRIGAATFFIPPIDIDVSQSFKLSPLSEGGLRQPNTAKFNSGHSEKIIRMTLYFPNHETIWGFEGDTATFNWDPAPIPGQGGGAPVSASTSDTEIDYFLSSLRGLITQFKYAPFLPIKNQFINQVYDITGVTLTNMTIATLADFPFCLAVTLQMSEFNHKVYLPMVDDFDQAFHWGKFRQYMGRAAGRLDSIVNQGFLSRPLTDAEISAQSDQAEIDWIKAGKPSDYQWPDIKTSAVIEQDPVNNSIATFDKLRDINDGRFFEIYYPISTPGRIFSADTNDFRQPGEDSVMSTEKWHGILNVIGIDAVDRNDTSFIEYDTYNRDLSLNSERKILLEWLDLQKISWQEMNSKNLADYKVYLKAKAKEGGYLNTYNEDEIDDRGDFVWLAEIYKSYFNDDIFKRKMEQAKYAAGQYTINEWKVPMEKVVFDWGSMIIEGVGVSLSNNIATMQLQMQEAPVHQHLGGGDSRVDVSMIVIGKANLIRLRRVFEHINGLARLEHAHGVLGFIGIKNVITALCGIKYALPISIETNTIAGYPDAYQVRISLVDFDVFQQKREELSSNQQDEFIEAFGKRNPFLRLKQKWSAFNAYPDMPLDVRDDDNTVVGHLDPDWYFRSFVTDDSDIFDWRADEQEIINVINALQVLNDTDPIDALDNESIRITKARLLRRVTDYVNFGNAMPDGYEVGPDGQVVVSNAPPILASDGSDLIYYMGNLDPNQDKVYYVQMNRAGNIVIGSQDRKTKKMTPYLSGHTFAEDLASKNQSPVSSIPGSISGTGYQNEYMNKSDNPSSQFELMMKDWRYRQVSGRMIRAFPTYMLWLIDEGGKFGGVKLFDNFYGLNSVIDFSVVSSEDCISDTLVLRVSNLYGKLSTPFKNTLLNEDDPLYDTATGKLIADSENTIRNLISGLTNTNVYLDKIRLKPGVRLHLRLGYGSNPNSLQTVFNGVVTEVQQGEIMTIIAQTDAVELTAMVNAQPLNAKIFTPSGMQTMKDIDVGDEVIGSDGKSTLVVDKSPIFYRDIYKVTFADGSIAECCDEHLWEVKASGNWQGKSKVIPLKDIRKNLFYSTYDKKRQQESKHWKFTTPVTKPVEFNDNTLPMPPLLLGLLLGDGSLNSRGSVGFTTADPELVETVQNLLPEGHWIIANSKYDYRITTKVIGRSKDGNAIRRALDSLGLRVHGHFKFVPESYKYTSIENRLAILQGLLDTDGTAETCGASFSSSSQQLAEDVVWLARSLGGFASNPKEFSYDVILPQGTATKSHGWKVYIRLPDNMQHFTLDRKNIKVGSTKATIRKTIVDVQFMREDYAQCIKVANEDGLYLVDGFILTHNTSDKKGDSGSIQGGINCFTADTPLNLWDGGVVRIGDIVKNNLTPVLVGSDENGNLVPSQVLGGHHFGPKDEWMQIKLSNHIDPSFKSAHNTMTCTPGHHIVINGEYSQAGDMKVGDTLTTFERVPSLSVIHLIKSSLLGDGCIIYNGTKSAAYKEAHCKQDEYIDYLWNSLGDSALKLEKYTSGKGSKGLIVRSKSYKILRELKEEWYPNGKKIVPENLDWVDDFTIAKWYMDDGSLASGVAANFATNSFNEIEVRRLAVKLEEMYQVQVYVYESNGWCLRVNKGKENQIEKMWKSITPFILPSMRYKVPDIYRNTDFTPYEVNGKEDIVKINSVAKEIKWLPSSIRKQGGGSIRHAYDITTSTGNYFCRGILVHNTGFWLSEPRDLIVRLMSMGSSSFKEWVSWGTKGAVFSENKFGIRHFGSILYETMNAQEEQANQKRGQAINISMSEMISGKSTNQSDLNQALGSYAKSTSDLDFGSIGNIFNGNMIAIMEAMWANSFRKRDYELFKRNVYPGNGLGIAQFMAGDMIDGGIILNTTAKYIEGQAVTPATQNPTTTAKQISDANKVYIDELKALEGISIEDDTALADTVNKSDFLATTEGQFQADDGITSFDVLHGVFDIVTNPFGWVGHMLNINIGWIGYLVDPYSAFVGLAGHTIGKVVSIVNRLSDSPIGKAFGLGSEVEDDDLNGYDEVSFRAQTYMKSVWDLFRTCSALLPNYIVAIRPFEDRSTVFYGKPHWLYTSGVIPVSKGIPKDASALPKIEDPDGAIQKLLGIAAQNTSAAADLERTLSDVSQLDSLDVISTRFNSHFDTGVAPPGLVDQMPTKWNYQTRANKGNQYASGSGDPFLPYTSGAASSEMHLPAVGEDVVAQTGHIQSPNLPLNLKWPFNMDRVGGPAGGKTTIFDDPTTASTRLGEDASLPGAGGAWGDLTPEEEQYYCSMMWPFEGNSFQGVADEAFWTKYGSPEIWEKIKDSEVAGVKPQKIGYRLRRVLVVSDKTGKAVVCTPGDVGPLPNVSKNNDGVTFVIGLSPDTHLALGTVHGDTVQIRCMEDNANLGPLQLGLGTGSAADNISAKAFIKAFGEILTNTSVISATDADEDIDYILEKIAIGATGNIDLPEDILSKYGFTIISAPPLTTATINNTIDIIDTETKEVVAVLPQSGVNISIISSSSSPTQPDWIKSVTKIMDDKIAALSGVYGDGILGNVATHVLDSLDPEFRSTQIDALKREKALLARDPIAFTYQFGWKYDTAPVYVDPSTNLGYDETGMRARVLWSYDYAMRLGQTNRNLTDHIDNDAAGDIWNEFRLNFPRHTIAQEDYLRRFPEDIELVQYDKLMDLFLRFMWQSAYNRAWIILKADAVGDGIGDDLAKINPIRLLPFIDDADTSRQWSFKNILPAWMLFIQSQDITIDENGVPVSPKTLAYMKNNQQPGKDATEFFQGVAENIGDWWDANLGDLMTVIGNGIKGFISTIRMSLLQLGVGLGLSGTMQKQANILNSIFNDSIYYQAGTDDSLLRLVDNPFTREYGEPVVEIREPFQRAHFISSFQHIISNGISENLTNVPTVVTAVSDGKYPVTVHLDKGMSPERQVEQVVETGLYWDNALGSGLTGVFQPFIHPIEALRSIAKTTMGSSDLLSSRRVALSYLKEGLKDIYTGEILVLGDADIRPHDLVFIADIYERIYGMVEVEKVIHHMTSDTGFITAITPNAIVTVNDPGRWSLISWMWRKWADYNIRNDTRAALSIKADRNVARASEGIASNEIADRYGTQILGGIQWTQGNGALVSDFAALYGMGGMRSLSKQDDDANKIAAIDNTLLLTKAGLDIGGVIGGISVGLGGSPVAGATIAAGGFVIGDLLWDAWQWVKDNMLDQHGCYIQYLNKDGQPLDAGLSYAQGVAAGQHHSVSVFPSILGIPVRSDSVDNGHYRITSNDLLSALGWTEVETAFFQRDTSLFVNVLNKEVLRVAGRGPDKIDMTSKYIVLRARVLDLGGEEVNVPSIHDDVSVETEFRHGVIDGDTIDVEILNPVSGVNFIERIRLSAVNTPETWKSFTGAPQFDDTAGQLAKAYVESKFNSEDSRNIVLRVDPSNMRDSTTNHRLLAIVFQNLPLSASRLSTDKKFEILEGLAKQEPIVSWDSYFEDGRPYTLNWELVMAGYGNVDVRDTNFAASWRTDAVGYGDG